MAYIWLISGLILLFFSGNWLIKSSVDLSKHFKVSTFVIGLTVVAFGTSAPELFVSLKAVYTGVPDIAIGNIVGSNIANIGLVLGLVVIFMPITIKNTAILFDWSVMLLATIILFIFAYNGILGVWEGVIFLVILVLYLLHSILKSHKKTISEEKGPDAPSMKIIFAILIVFASIIGLYYGADLLIKGAHDIALSWGVSDRVIGVSIVAVGTSLPELAASLIAVFKKENDISVGNIIGSNIFNILGNLGVTATVKPLYITDTLMFRFDLLMCLFLAVILLIFMHPLSKGNINRWKGFIMIFIYFMYIYFIFK